MAAQAALRTLQASPAAPAGGRRAAPAVGRSLAPARPRAQAGHTAATATAASPAHLARVSAPSTIGRPAPPSPPAPLLSYEVVQGALVRYSAADASKVPTAVLVHGILGRRQNMLSFARRLVEGFPHWQVVVPDLRCHGESAARGAGARAPHSVDAAAADVIRLLSALKLFPEMLIGHSFGGKVVLQMTQAWSGAARRVPRPVQVWVLDALPGEVRSGDMGGADRPADLISTLLATPLPVPSRHWLISHLEAAGFSRTVAAWAATNLAPAPGGGPGMAWAFDLAGIAQLFRSYEATDLWPLLASPADGVRLSFVKAARSTFRWGGGDEARIRALGHAVHELPDAGHWVHSDNPDGLFDILAPSFGGPADLHMRRSPRGAPPAANNIQASPAAAASHRQLQGLMM